MPRTKGSKNDKTVSAEGFVKQVEDALAKGQWNDNFINLTCRHLTRNGRDASLSLTALLRMLEMKYGKPKQPTEISGKDGAAILVKVTHVGS
jgi:hypothetical protein